MRKIPHPNAARQINIVAAPGLVMRIDPEYEKLRIEFMHGLISKYAKVRKSDKPYDERYTPGPPGQCFDNAANLVKRHPELTYCEGLLVIMNEGRPSLAMPHGWCLTPEGDVLDPTCAPAQHRPDIVYLGIAFQQPYVDQWHETNGFHGLLDGHPEYGDTVGVYVDPPSLWLKE